MKKFYLVLLLSILLVGGSVFADVVQTTRQIRRDNRVQTQTKTDTSNVIQTRRRTTGNKLADNIMICKPYNEILNTDVAGINFTFKLSIAGWVNNKCRLDFIAQSTGISQMFEQLYGTDASNASIYTFEPKIRCEFTKQQLLDVGDSILQENERNAGARNNMLKNPEDVVIPSASDMSISDAKLMDVILNDKACTILNAGDSSKMFESLFAL